ncbi:MAG: hypothetical protein B7Y43_08850 [Sphingomonas sp. 28-62-20]|nr:MAG: hypothetical protein B7Y43_08850 [Sphingomonas sp. 28-62-20]
MEIDRFAARLWLDGYLVSFDKPIIWDPNETQASIVHSPAINRYFQCQKLGKIIPGMTRRSAV